MKIRVVITALLAFCAIAAAAIAGWQATGAARARSDATAMLAAAGFVNPAIPPLRRNNGTLLFENIRLDKDGFCTIGAIQLPAGHSFMPWENQKNSTKTKAIMTLDDLSLVGAYEPATGLNIPGWQMGDPTHISLPGRVIVNGAKIDIDTTEGSLRFNGKGDLSPQPGGGLALRGLLWAVQNQIRFEGRMNAHMQSGEEWLAEVEFDNAAVNFSLLKSSRLSGWMTLEKKGGAPLRLTGQLDAGKLSYGPFDLATPSLILSGEAGTYAIAVQAKMPGYPTMNVTGEIKINKAIPAYDMTVETDSITDMGSFLHTLGNAEIKDSSFSGMLPSKKNIDSAIKQIGLLEYDMLVLKIFGMLGDFSLRLSADISDQGVTRRHVISLDAPPAE